MAQHLLSQKSKLKGDWGNEDDIVNEKTLITVGEIMKYSTARKFFTRLVRVLTVTLTIFILFPGFVSPLLADDTGIDGFNGLFFRPNVDGQGILNVDSSNILFPGVAHVGSHFQYARRTISFSDPALGGLVTDLAENQVLMNLVLGVGLFEFLDIGMDVPIVLMQNGTKCLNATCSNLTNYTGFGLGDMRFVIKLRLLNEKEYPIGLALASDIGIPTGKRRLFTGGKNASYEQRLIISKKFKYVEAAANVGYRVVDRVQAIGINYDDQFTFGVGAKGFLPHNIFAFGTIAGNIFLSDGGDADTPVEFMGGVGYHWKKQNLACHVGGGARLVDGVAAADYRVMGSCGIDFGLTKKARHYLKTGETTIAVLPKEEWIIPMRTNQSRLRLKQKEVLDDVIRWLNEDPTRQVEIIGNADDRASYDYNMRLSTKRAMAARNYLFRRGVAPQQIIMSTHGEASPIAKGKTSEDRTQNRSIIIRELRYKEV